MRSWSCKISCSPGLARQVALKKTKVKLDHLTDIDMLIIVEEGMRGGYVTLFINMEKLMTNTWKIMIKIKNFHVFNIGM